MSSDPVVPPLARRASPGVPRRLLPAMLALLGVLSACTEAHGAPPATNASSAQTPPTARSQDGRQPTGGGSAPGTPREAVAPAAPTKGTNEEATRETAYLAGGCFWGMEDLLREIPGVIETEVGYTGGAKLFSRPTYDDVHTGRTGHAESVRVVFNPKLLTYEALLEKWFFRMHDPTTLNRQGNDVGTQYRSAIFYLSDEQRRVAEKVRARVDASGKWKRPVVTEITAAGEFTPAEQYHQDYLVKNPGGYTCHYMRE
ncbi:Peptide methionine sulfoxide reductase MsrB [Cystobacter fuscus DSM 2262]|uniref:Peptide methionine sulfoxide reductase MsrA n=1 Tax=Cystobacter fuscus (strain ATCC 25194 / DSM 2262 / NBRC 100088 / M29) TaxID=1242864 RepID=S9PF15_CYSF2|nr:peptide-methionine (S)-S-oxide reductase MsrA [Cystobacter fuscus]EPX61601.1 Peptide methionine sulfoxide reductase MsrB [Cystobacter fuscus DSM 2262]